MYKKPAFFKFIPWKERNPIMMTLAIIAAAFFITIAGFMWYFVIIGAVDPVYWVSALLTSVGGFCSIMTVVTGESSWMLIGLIEW